MKLETFGEHTICPALLSEGIAIDVGCRGFAFSIAMRDKGCKVYAFDVDEMAAPEGIIFFQKAVQKYTGKMGVVDTMDLQAKYIIEDITNSNRSIDTIYLLDLYKTIGTNIDVLKLDCEGSEYNILSDSWLLHGEHAPKQITVEFHEHCQKEKHDMFYSFVMECLLENYITVQHQKTQQHGAGYNYWDSLFIRKDLL